MLSPGVASPCVPSAKSGCVSLPPTPERLAVAVMPVLGGLVPGVTATVTRVLAPLQLFRPLGVTAPLAHSTVLLLSGVKVSFRPCERPPASHSKELYRPTAPLCTPTVAEEPADGTAPKLYSNWELSS